MDGCVLKIYYEALQKIREGWVLYSVRVELSNVYIF